MAYFGKKLKHTLMPQELIRLGDGVNRSNGPFDMKKSEAYTSLNTCSDKFPALSVRSGMAKDYTDVTGPINAIGIRDNSQVHIQDGTIWKKWNSGTSSWDTLATGLANTPSKIFDFTRETDRLTVLVNGTNRKYYDGTTVYDLWSTREGVAAPWDWEDPVIINNKMYVRVVSATKATRNSIGIYDIIEDEWSLGTEMSAIGASNEDTATPGWRNPVAYGNTIYVTTTVTSGAAPNVYFKTEIFKYNISNSTWTKMALPPDFSYFEQYIGALCVVGDYLYAVFHGSVTVTYLLEYDIKEDSWDYFDELDVPQTFWAGAISYNGKLYARNIDDTVIWFDPTRGEEEWDSYSGNAPLALKGTPGATYYFMFALGDKLYARTSGLTTDKIIVYDSTNNTWDETLESAMVAGALYVTSYDNVILSKGDSYEVLWYFTSLDIFGDDDTFTAPLTNLYTSDHDRLFTLTDSEMRCSDVYIPTEWIYGDAHSVTIAPMIGDGTAIVYYKNMVICWSEQSMHILLGENSDNFRFIEKIDDGCISARGHTINEGTLYFMDHDAVKTFTGGLTREISQKVRNYLENINYTYKSKICMGSDGRYVYVSFPYLTSTTNDYTLVYDTQNDNWYPWNKGFNEFVRMGEYLYAIDSTGIWKLNYSTTDNGTAITWSHETGAWNEGVLRQQKAISDLYMLADLPTGSTLVVSYSTSVDNNDWVTLYTFVASANEQNTRIQIPTSALQPINWYRLKFAGTGPCTIFYLEPHIRIKSR